MNSVPIGRDRIRTDNIDISDSSLLSTETNKCGPHVITVGTEATLNKYSVAMRYEDGAYKALIADRADIYFYPNIRRVGAWVRRAGFMRDETSEIVLR